MKLADEMLLAQMRESVLQDVPENQWNLVVDEVEKAGGVRSVQGYSRTLLFDAIEKASFGGNRSEAGRYAANVRWQGKGESDLGDGSGGRIPNPPRGKSKKDEVKGKTQEVSSKISQDIKDANLSGLARIITRDLNSQGKKIPFGAQPYLDALRTLDDINDNYYQDSGKSIVAYTLSNLASYKGETARQVKAELKRRLKGEELKEGNIADELPNPNMPPLYNDYGDEPDDFDRARATLRGSTVPVDLKDPLASQVTTGGRDNKGKGEKGSIADKYPGVTTVVSDETFSNLPDVPKRSAEETARIVRNVRLLRAARNKKKS